MVKRYQKEMDEEAAKQAGKDKIWNEAIWAAAKYVDETDCPTGDSLRQQLKREIKR